MKVNFEQALEGLDRKPLMDGETPVTLGAVAVNALMTPMEGDDKLTGDDKLAHWLLAGRIQNATGPLDITPEEATKIKDRIGRGFAPAVVGPAFIILNGS